MEDLLSVVHLRVRLNPKALLSMFRFILVSVFLLYSFHFRGQTLMNLKNWDSYNLYPNNNWHVSVRNPKYLPIWNHRTKLLGEYSLQAKSGEIFDSSLTNYELDVMRPRKNKYMSMLGGCEVNESKKVTQIAINAESPYHPLSLTPTVHNTTTNLWVHGARARTFSSSDQEQRIG